MNRRFIIILLTLALLWVVSSSVLGAGIIPQLEMGTEIDPTDTELECYMKRYPNLKTRYKVETVSDARNHWYRVGWGLGWVPHCPRDRTLAPPPLSNNEARRYANAYQDLRTRLQGDIAKAKAHWNRVGWFEGRIVPPPSKDLWKKMISLMGAEKSMYCGVNGEGVVECNRDTVGLGEIFNMEQMENNAFLLKNAQTNQYCSDEGRKLQCTREASQATPFVYQRMGAQRMAFVSGKSGKPLYCADDANNIVCDRGASGPRAIFNWTEAAIPPPPLPDEQPSSASSAATTTTTTTTTTATTPSADDDAPTVRTPPSGFFQTILRRLFARWV
jgi:hypothetical protein